MHPAEFQSTSGSSSSSTETTSSSATSVQDTTSSGSTSLYSAPKMRSHIVPSSVFNVPNSAPKLTSQQSTVSSSKQYKNSPFGLKNHFLAMPDSNDEETGHLSQDDLNSNASDAIYSDSASSPNERWADFTTTSQHRLFTHTDQPRPGLKFDQLLLPAGDAGLDASKCVAKDSEQCEQVLGSCPQSQINKDGSMKLSRGVELAKLSTRFDSAEASGSASLLVIFSSIMYATFLVILGCIFHISELRQKSKNSSDHIYTIVVALIGILWLLFLQMDLHRYKSFARRYILIESIYNDHQQAKKQADERLSRASALQSTASSSASLVNDRLSMDTEIIFKKSALKMYRQQEALNREHDIKVSRLKSPVQRAARFHGPKLAANATADGIIKQLNSPGSKLGKSTVKPSSESGSSICNSFDDVHKPPTSDDQNSLEPAYKFLHGKMGANFYLKCGMAAFCFGHVIHEGLRFGQQVYFFGTGNVHCRDSAALVAHMITPLYSFYQLFMMFKYSNLVINRHKVLAKFGLMHIIGTSVTFWFRTILEEAFEDFVHKMDYFKTNRAQSKLNPSGSALVASGQLNNRSDNENNPILTLMSSPISDTITPQLVRHLPDSYACAQNTLLTTKSMNALPYLYPFTIEYNLLLAATFLSLYINIGRVGHQGSGAPGCRYSLNCKTRANYPNFSDVASKAVSSNSSTSREFHDNSSSTTRTGSSISAHQKDFNIGEYKSNFVVNADCHSANKGLFCGFFVLLVALVTIVIFFVTINKPTHVELGIKINLIQEAVLTMLILIVTLVGLKQIAKLNRNPYLREKVTTDDVLMLIPLPFFFIHSLLSFRAETASMTLGCNGSMLCITSIKPSSGVDIIGLNANMSVQSGGSISTSSDDLNASHEIMTSSLLPDEFISDSHLASDAINPRERRNVTNSSSNANGGAIQVDHFKLITVALNIFVMIEVLVQTNFIIDGMRRCSESRYLRFKKPARELVTFAILLNITYWIVATFETKSVEQYKTEIEYYGPLPYMFISHTTLPVMLFYRYHSSVCLTEIWNRAYKPPKKL